LADRVLTFETILSLKDVSRRTRELARAGKRVTGKWHHVGRKSRSRRRGRRFPRDQRSSNPVWTAPRSCGGVARKGEFAWSLRWGRI